MARAFERGIQFGPDAEPSRKLLPINNMDLVPNQEYCGGIIGERWPDIGE